MVSLTIQKLFSRFNYDIVFKPDGVTIITGPNGFGKSTLLRCIEALSNKDIYFFAKLDFEKLKVNLENSTTITLEKNEKELVINGSKFPLTMLRKMHNPNRHNPYLVRMDDDKLYDTRNQIVYYDDGEFINKSITYYEPDMLSDNKLSKKFNEILEQIRNQIGKIYYIKEQRLIKERKERRSEQEVINVIEALPDKFKKLIGNISSNYSTIANKLDSTYPNRLFSMDSTLSEDEYKQNMDEMTKKFEKLRDYDISEIQNTTNVIFKKEHAKALKIYFSDFNEKFKVYEDFIKKLDLFTGIVNSRLYFNEIKISRENGILVVAKDNPQKTLSLNQLSSGEKQEIVLFYELIFEVNNNILLLIDEPEISLHIGWQKNFMDDLLKIVNYKNIKVIVATHSPQIINNHWERQIDLGDLYGKQLDKR